MESTNAITQESGSASLRGPFQVACAAGGIPLLLLALALSFPTDATSAPFFIATHASATGCAFDGRNYLVGLENHQTTPPTVEGQLFAADGTRIGMPIRPGRTGIATTAAFDGTRYLMIWEDDRFGTLQGGFQLYGQFISKAGKTVGSPFPITAANIWFDGIKVMAFGAGKYLVTYTRLIKPASGDQWDNRYIGGRIVNPDGTMGTPFRISSGYGDAPDVAFDGTNFLVVWCDDSADAEIRGRFVSPDGVCGTEISINASAAKSDNPKSVAFDGANYLVVWNDERAGTRSWDVFGQRISPSGEKVGGVIPITTESGPQMATSVAFDGINSMAVWIDMQDEANWNVYGQVIDTNGVLVGAKRTITAAPGNQIGFVAFADSRYLCLVTDGVILGDSGFEQVGAASGVFVKPPETRIIGLGGALSFGNVYTGQTATAILAIANKGNRDLTVSGITYPAGFSGDWSGVLAAGRTTNVTVTFAPEAARAYSGMVTVNSDKTGGGNAIGVSGTGMSADLAGQIRFNSSSYSAPEGTKASVLVSRVYGSSGTVAVSYMTSPITALAGQDYGSKGNTLIWTNGQTGSKIITINIRADGMVEGDERFKVVLDNPVGTTLAVPARAVITIPANSK